MNKHILFIDDEIQVRLTFSRILERAGFGVTTAADGIEGLMRFSESPHDLIYLDVNMPGMTGLEVLMLIRKSDISTPVILLTGQPNDQAYNNAFRYGATDYVLKPLKPEKIIELTRRILSE